ncbi:MAG: beta-galactosidase [Demequinaceae bacterium]|nr:beta-galactosidase [Demequinaceae bacterium]
MEDRFLFGAAYYPEYQRVKDVQRDMELMAEAGFTVIRVGESVWSTWEPRDGDFDLDWLQPTLDAAHEYGIGVILGTPTYAAPMWLVRRYPEIAGAPATGARLQWGARQEMDFTHAAFLFHAERIIREVVGRYKDHPAVIGYQVDNEPGLRLLYNDTIFERFRDHLRGLYGDVENVNDAWNLTYWSHRLSDWADLWRPDGNMQPQYDLAWRRFQAQLVTEYIGWQADIVRELVGPDATVTTCISYEQPGIEDVDLSARLSVASGNAYYEMGEALAHPSAAPASDGPMGWIVNGAWAVQQLGDLMYSSRQDRFLVTETNAGSIGFSMINQSPFDGQWKQAAWALVSRGADMIEYWHWNTLDAGAETYWGGVLPHHGQPGRAYREIAELGGQLASGGAAFRGAVPEHDIAVLYDTDSKFALAAQPPFAAPGAYANPGAYRRIVEAFGRGIFDAGLQQRLVRPQQVLPSRGGVADAATLAAAYPVLIVPAFVTASDEDLDFLRHYASAGGHLVVGPRTAAADREGRARGERLPARLAEAAGATWEECVTLREPVKLEGPALTGSAVDYAEGLEAGAASALATYAHPHLGRWAAVTTRAHGQGNITLVGCVPDQDLARSLAAWLVPAPVAAWQGLPASVTVSSSLARDGARLRVMHHWAWGSADVVAPEALEDLLSGATVRAGESIHLGPWDVRVFRTAPASH